MRNLKTGRKLGRKRNQKKALLKSMARSLLIKEKIRVTLAKAKELRPFIEPLISKARNDTLPNRRILLKYFEKELVEKIMLELGPRYKTRPGGYIRIIKLGRRKTDGAEMAIIELIK